LSLGNRTLGEVERWCNGVAAEFLVPPDLLHRQMSDTTPPVDQLDRLAREFRVSTLVILKRLHEGNYLDWGEFRAAYVAEVDRVLELAGQDEGQQGGNFYNTQPLRVSKTFARALVSEAIAGRTTYTHAFQLLGIRKSSTLFQLGEHLGVA
ncbi:MAG: ImmA/IrrE family metallo-endopeptidase, partial [Acidimicrobiia bacterium]